MTGPRSRAVAAPQTMGKRAFAPGSGCDVRRICSVRLERFIAISLNDVGAPLPTRLTILRPHDVGVPAQALYLYTNTARTSPGDKNSLTGAAAGLPQGATARAERADNSAGSGTPEPSPW